MRSPKIFIILIITLIAAACLVWAYMTKVPSVQQPNTVADEKKDEVNFDPQTGQTIRTPNAPSAIYHNEKLGIELAFPSEFLDPLEHWYKGVELFAVTFKKTDSEFIQLTPAESIRSCDDVMKNGFHDGELVAFSCEPTVIDGNAATIVTFKQGYQNAPWKEVNLVLNKRVWTLSTSEETLYDILLDMAHSAKALPYD